MKIILTILFWCLAMSSNAQRPVIFTKPLVEDPQMKFIRLTTDDGLSHNRVTDIIQDHHGFVWIATVDGLNRYDGKHIEVYRNNMENFTSLTSSFISCIDESENGELYIGTKKGLNKYIRNTNSFELISLDKMNKHPYIRQIMFDNDSILWIETGDGYLIKFNVNQKAIIKSYKHTTVNQKFYLYHDIYRDKKGVLWVGTRNTDPFYLDEESDQLVIVAADENDFSKKRAHDMACFFEDSNDNFWFTALDGIYLYNRDSIIFNKFLGTTTYDIVEDTTGNIWFATGSGVMRYSPEKELITLMKNEKDNPYSISDNNVHNIMKDGMGNLWFGTNIGVNIYSPPAYPFKHYTHIPGITNSPEGYVVTAVCEDNKNNLWIGYEDDGVDYYNRKLGLFEHYLSNSDVKNSIASNKVSSLLLDDKERLWIGLWRGIGFNLMDTKTRDFRLFTYDPSTLEKDWYSDFVEDDNGNFYLGFWGGDGLVGFDRDKKEFLSTYKEKFERVECSRLITKLISDNSNSIWFGTTECGLHRYFPDNDSAVSYFYEAENSHGLTSDKIADITIDINGNIWFINNRLQKYQSENDTFISYGSEDGLFSNELSSVLVDGDGDVWVGTANDGLFKFDPITLRFDHYLKQDGLQSNSFTRASIKLINNEVFMGCNNGFVIFNPRDIIQDTRIPVPFFGRLFVSDYIVSHDLNAETRIDLESDENVFSIELLSSDIVNPQRFSYQCQLVGYDENWVEIVSNQRLVRYAAVPSGKYKLKYRIGDRKGLWSTKTAEIWVAIMKPFYLTWWFVTTVLVILTILFYLFIKQREYDLKQKNRNIELQQRLFRLQMNPHFMYNSLLAIQNFIFLHNPKEAGNYLSDFARLFRLILNNSKSEFIKISKEVETLSLYLKLQSLRYPDKFTYNIYLDPEIDIDFILIPPMLAQPMIENALEHGLYYKEGKGHIEVRFMIDGNQLIFEVEDNGVGFTKSKKKKISEDHISSGLDITRERIKILGKRYKYYAFFEIKEIKDNYGTILGTKVRFNLPTRLSLLDDLA